MTFLRGRMVLLKLGGYRFGAKFRSARGNERWLVRRDGTRVMVCWNALVLTRK
jgi:hypothetical protein